MAKREAEEERRRWEVAERHQQDFATWSTSVRTTIVGAVHRASDEATGRGSPYFYRAVPQSADGSAVFEVHRSGGADTLAALSFVLGADGKVKAFTKVSLLLSAAALDEATAEWAETVATDLLVRLLEGAAI